MDSWGLEPINNGKIDLVIGTHRVHWSVKVGLFAYFKANTPISRPDPFEKNHEHPSDPNI